jgi:hypothetical protein
LREDQVTNDLAFARAVAAEDAQVQAAIRSHLAGPTATVGAGNGSAPNPPPSAPIAARASTTARAPTTAQAPPAPTRAPMGNTALDNNGGVGPTHDKVIDHKRWHKTISGGWIYN